MSGTPNSGLVSREPSHSSFAMADEDEPRIPSNTAMFTQVSMNFDRDVFRCTPHALFIHKFPRVSCSTFSPTLLVAFPSLP